MALQAVRDGGRHMSNTGRRPRQRWSPATCRRRSLPQYRRRRRPSLGGGGLQHRWEAHEEAHHTCTCARHTKYSSLQSRPPTPSYIPANLFPSLPPSLASVALALGFSLLLSLFPCLPLCVCVCLSLLLALCLWRAPPRSPSLSLRHSLPPCPIVGVSVCRYVGLSVYLYFWLPLPLSLLCTPSVPWLLSLSSAPPLPSSLLFPFVPLASAPPPCRYSSCSITRVHTCRTRSRACCTSPPRALALRVPVCVCVCVSLSFSVSLCVCHVCMFVVCCWCEAWRRV